MVRDFAVGREWLAWYLVLFVVAGFGIELQVSGSRAGPGCRPLSADSSGKLKLQLGLCCHVPFLAIVLDVPRRLSRCSMGWEFNCGAGQNRPLSAPITCSA